MSNNKTFRIILCVAIIVAFFLPWFKYGGGSGLDIVLSKTINESTTEMVVRYSFLLIPFFALIVLFRSLSNKPTGFVKFLPFLVTAILVALFIIGVRHEGGGDAELKGWFAILGAGLYISAISSFLLMLI